METSVYNQEGKVISKVNIPEAIFDLKWNGDLVHQVVISLQSNKRTPVAHTKDRSDVRGGGRKPWRQKGTGRARVGSSRSPLWRGGGATFGPRKEKDYSKKVNKKMKIKALYVSLSQKLRDGEILFIDSLTLSEPKTSKAKDILTALSSIDGFDTLLSKRNNSALLSINEKDNIVERSFDNIGNIEVGETRNLNVLDVLSYKYIIIVEPKEAVTFLESKTSPSSENKKVNKNTDKKEDIKKPVKKTETKKSLVKKTTSKEKTVKKVDKKTIKK